MNSQFTTCEGRKCPSKANCKRFNQQGSHETTQAALWARREAGASACEMFISSLPSTFEAKPFQAAKKAFCTYPACTCPFDAPADPNWCARGYEKKSKAQ